MKYIATTDFLLFQPRDTRLARFVTIVYVLVGSGPQRGPRVRLHVQDLSISGR